MDSLGINKQLYIEDKKTGFVGKIERRFCENVAGATEKVKNGFISATLVSDNGDILKKELLFDEIKNITEEEFDERIETIRTILNIKINRISKFRCNCIDDNCLS